MITKWNRVEYRVGNNIISQFFSYPCDWCDTYYDALQRLTEYLNFTADFDYKYINNGVYIKELYHGKTTHTYIEDIKFYCGANDLCYTNED